MTKADFILAVQVEAGVEIKKSTIEKVLDAAGAVSLTLIKDGDTVPLLGLGSIKVAQRAAHTGRNPRTGAQVDIPARRVAKYSASKAVKDALN